MLQVSVEAPVKYKRRIVVAIRQFPRGCGPNSIQLTPNLSSSTVLENGKITGTDEIFVATNFAEETIIPPLDFKEEVQESPGSLKVLNPEVADLPIDSRLENLEIKKVDVQQIMETINVLKSNAESIPVVAKVEVQQEKGTKVVPDNESGINLDNLEVQQAKEESVGFSKLQKKQNHYSMLYGPLRRRAVSAVRQFPLGCGPNVDSIRKDDNQHDFVPPDSLISKSFTGNKTYEASKHLARGVSTGAADGDLWVKLKHNDGKGAFQENGDQETSNKSAIVPFVTFSESKPFYGEKDLSWQPEMAGGSTLVIGAKKSLHTDNNISLPKSSIRTDGSSQVIEDDHSLNQDKPLKKQAQSIDQVAKTSCSAKAMIDDIKSFKTNKGKEAPFDKRNLVRSNSDKNCKVQGKIDHVQIKSSLKSASNGKSILKSGSNELFVCSSSNRTVESCKVDRAVLTLQDKANAGNPSQLVVKSQAANKHSDENDIISKEKPIRKENVMNINSSKKRKLPLDIVPYKDHFSGDIDDSLAALGEKMIVVPYKDHFSGDIDDSLAALGEKMIVQSLMSANNCPWRNPRKRGVVGSADSIALKRKIRKEKGFVGKNIYAKEASPSQQKRKDLIMNNNNIPDDYSNLSITMTPFVPSESSQKGGDVVVRHKVKKALRLFQLICRKLLQGEESRSKRLGKINRIDLQGASILKDNGEWVNSGEPLIGHVPGVEIGDEFHFRVELAIVGLHRPFQGGIDSMKKNGMLLATSIVASGGYQDDMDSSDVLIYSGSGGTSAVGGEKQQGDQKLERGNLALKNSIDALTPVRVIHGFKEKGSDSYDSKSKIVSTFTYDGLYQVESYWQEIGNHGFNVFRFQLRRVAGQPELALKELKRSAKLKIREGLRAKDISQGKEKIPIAVVNIIDSEQPIPFKYITKNIYPSWYVKAPPKGCDCTDGCSDSEKCACAVKNGGEIPFNFNGAIVQAKPLIYECGPSCKCSPSCHNRVSQRGIRMQLEVFKTKGRGWGVRSLKSISSGSFICEYIGELLQDCDAEQRTNDEYLFDIGHNYDDRSLWEDLPNFIPGLQNSSECDTVESVGFTIDAAEYGNIGRFINHSCSPNLYAQNVLYDHDDKRLPHIMFFAVDNIPPLKELTYHYNYTIDQVRDSEGNIKQKACYCGSSECCGRLY